MIDCIKYYEMKFLISKYIIILNKLTSIWYNFLNLGDKFKEHF